MIGGRVAGRLLAASVFALLGLAVLEDGTSSVLIARDSEAPNRVMACYTALELAVGVNEPSFLRPLEISVGLALLCYAPWAGRHRVKRDFALPDVRRKARV
jgi:hypothetical protein